MEACTETECAVRLLGLGNELLADDAFGILVAREVERRQALWGRQAQRAPRLPTGFRGRRPCFARVDRRKRLSHLAPTPRAEVVCSSASGFHLLDQILILQQDGAVRTHGERVLIAFDRDPGVRRRRVALRLCHWPYLLVRLRTLGVAFRRHVCGAFSPEDHLGFVDGDGHSFWNKSSLAGQFRTATEMTCTRPPGRVIVSLPGGRALHDHDTREITRRQAAPGWWHDGHALHGHAGMLAMRDPSPGGRDDAGRRCRMRRHSLVLPGHDLVHAAVDPGARSFGRLPQA